MRWDIRKLCESKPKTAYVELEQLDSSAVFRYVQIVKIGISSTEFSSKLIFPFQCSEPEIVASGQIKVTVTLPKLNRKFSGLSRDAQLAKWGAAKTAVNELKNRKNVFIPEKQKEILDRYIKMQPPNSIFEQTS